MGSLKINSTAKVAVAKPVPARKRKPLKNAFAGKFSIPEEVLERDRSHLWKYLDQEKLVR